MRGLALEVVRIAQEAGEDILEIYNDESNFGVELKSDQSPLTKADKKANDTIVKRLKLLEKQFPIISEENKQLPFEERKHFKSFWLVDPLDGTKEFIKRNGEFTVNIALIEDGRPVLGVVYVPVTRETFWAVKGMGSFHIKEEKESKLDAKKFSMNDQNLRIVCSRSHINEDTQNFINALNNPVPVSKGSSLKFLLIASGQAELYPRMGPTMEWDTGAAQIVLEEAGGEVLHHETMQPLTYNKSSLLNPYFIARAKLN